MEAFEPAPYNREILLATGRRNGMLERVTVHDFALGDIETQSTLVATNADVGASSAAHIPDLGEAELPPGVDGQVQALSRVSVQVRRLDGVFSQASLPRPDVLKIDVEGAEAAVLAGGVQVIEEARPAILCEIHNVDVALRIASRLAEMEYHMHILGKNGPHTACLWLPGYMKAEN